MKTQKTLSALAFAFVLLLFLNATATAQTGLSLTGQLTNDRGEALPGQTISLNGPTGGSTTTDVNGRYTFSVWPGTYSLWIGNGSYDGTVHAPMGYTLYTSSFDVTDNATLDLQLPFKKLTVHVQDSQGIAIPNVGIETSGPWAYNLAVGSLPTGALIASGYSGYSYNPPSGILTNANGDVDLWLLPTPSDPMSCSMPPCTYTLYAHPPSDSQFPVTALSDVTLTQDGSITITLNPAVSLTGQVTNDRGEVLPGQSLYLNGPAWGQATTDANGQYAFSVSAGTYNLSINSDPYRALHAPMIYNLNSSSFAVNENMTLDLSLPFKRVNVHVVDTSEHPVAGVGLFTNAPWVSGLMLGSLSFSGSSSYWYDPIMNPNSVATDADGNATLWLLPTSNVMPGEGYSFTAIPPAGSGLFTAVLSNVAVTGDASVTIRFTPPVTLSGRITDAAGNGLLSQNISLSGPVSFAGVTDSSGYYAISATPGNYSVQLSGFTPAGSTLHAPQNYNLSSSSFTLSQNTTLDLSLPFQRVNVHVLDASDQPVAGAGLNTDAPWVSGLTSGGLSFSGSSSYWYAPDMGGGPTTDGNGNATLWLLPTTGSMGGQGYAFTAYAPAETGLPPAYFPYVFVTGETDLTIHFAGSPQPPPVITSVSPDSVVANGPAFTLTVNGTGFVNGSTVQWNGSGRATTFVSSTLLTAAIPASDLIMPGGITTATITVVNPNWGGTSDSVTVRLVWPPVLSNTNPTFLLANGFDQTLTVNGSWFVNGSTVHWNGSPRETTFISSWALQARILGSDLMPGGGVMTATVTVVNPNGGGTSNSVPVTITPFTGVVLSGRITDAAGNGLPNQSVTLSGPVWLSGVTDNTGHYAISASPGTYGLQLQGGVPVSSTLHAAQNYNLSSNMPITLIQNTTLDLTLPFQRVNVHVVDASDQPVAGAGLSTSGAGGSSFTVSNMSFWGSSSYWFDAYMGGGGITTDASGNATLWLLPVSDTMMGGYVLTATPLAETGLPPMSLSNVFVTGETNVTIRLAPPVVLSGRVTDAEGTGLPNQTVSLPAFAPLFASTDSSGHYAVSASPGSYWLQLQGGVPVSSTLHAAQGYSLYSNGAITLTQNMTLDLSLPFQRVNVHVVDAGDQPVAGAGLSTNAPWVSNLALGGMPFSGSSSYWYDPYMGGGGVTTDASGNAVLWLLPTGDPTLGAYTFTAFAPAETGLPPASLSNVLVTGQTNVTIRFSPPVTLSGRITDAEGTGLPDQSIGLSGPVWFSGVTDNTGHYAISASPGTYGLQLFGGVPISSTPHAPQGYSLYSNGAITLTQNMTLDLSLPFQRVNVHVVDASDQPVAGAGLSTSGAGGSSFTVGNLSFWGSSYYSYEPNMNPNSVATDMSGNATLWLLPVTDTMMGGYIFTAYPPAETGLPPVSLSNVFVTGETNVNIRFSGSLPGNAPVISSISPTSVPTMNPSFTLVVTGTNFVNGSVVRWNGTDLATTFISGTLLSAAVPATHIASVGTASITVFTPPPGGGTSNSVTLTIEKVTTVSTVASSAPSSVYGQSITLTATVTSTVGAPSGTVSFKEGSTTLASGALTGGVATFVTSTLAVGTHAITVEYGGDAAFSLSISQATSQTVDKASTTLTLTGSSPSPAVVGQPVTVTWATAVTAPGTGSPTGTVAVSDTETSCTANLPNTGCSLTFATAGSKTLAATFSGDANFVASSSPTMTLSVVNPLPVLTSLDPVSTIWGDPGLTLIMTGTQFVNGSVVRWNGVDRSTTFVSNTLLTATIPSTDLTSAGTANVTVWTPAPGGGESSALKFTILPPPDRTAPTVSAKGTTSTGDYTFGQWVTQTVQITLTAQDNEGGTGVKKITYAASGAQSIPVTEVVSSTATISINAEGATQITYSAVDNAGNRAADQTVLVKIDQTPPTLGTCPAAGPFLFNSGPQSIGPIVASDVPAGLDAASSQLSGSVDTSSLGVKTVAFLAKDLAGNSSDKSCDYTVLPSATLKVFTALHTVGAGTTPGVQKTPLAMSVKIFDLATVPSADVANYASVWNSGPGLVAPLAFVSAPSATTFGGGQANLYAVQVSAADSANKVTSGKYLVIGKVEGAETYVGAATDPLAPNSVTQEYLQVVQKSDGKKVPAVTISVPGSLLLIVEPAYLEFTTNTELFPIIYDAVDGTWEAVVKTDPPQGFISTPGALSVDVSTGQLAAVQFTVQDVGSQWTTTKVTNRIKHKGVDKTITSSVAMINRQPAITKTPTPTVTRTATLTPTAIVTATRTLTPTRTATATASATPTAMPKPTGTSTATPTATTVPTKTSTATPTPLPTQRPGSPGTATPKKSRTATPTATAAPSRTATSTPTKASTATPTRLPAQTLVPTTTATPKKAPTAKPTATRTLPPTKTPHLTATPRNTPAKR